MGSLVKGIGINDKSVRATIDGKNTKCYTLWTNMLTRCYSSNYIEKYPTYAGCSVSDTFKYYHLFYSWCQNQTGFNIADYQLDKDLLIKGNKIYSEDTCIFIPLAINSLIAINRSNKGTLPIGVSRNGNKFSARCMVDGKEKGGKLHLGTFDTPELAFNAYKTFKEDYIKQQAELYKNSLDVRAYNALINYIISIED